MPWLPRQPLRPDFCGCPPCPLCFDWAGDDGIDHMDGMRKFALDMSGGKTPSASDEQTLKDAAEAIHAANLSATQRIDAELKEQDRTQHLQREADAFRALKRKEAARPPAPRIDTRPTLDELDSKELEKLTRPKPKKEDLVTITLNMAPGFHSTFDEYMQSRIQELISRPIGSPSFYITDETASLDEPAEKSAKDLQADFARDDAKKRMREMARAKS